MGNFVIPRVQEIQRITERYESQVPAIRSAFEGELGKKLNWQRTLLVGGVFTAAFALFGGAIVTMIKTAALATVWGLVLGVLLLVGYIGFRMLPRLELQLANSERERVDAEMHRCIEAHYAEMNRHIEAIKAEVRRDPIGFLEAEHVRKSQVYEKVKAAVMRFAGRMGTFRNTLERRKQDNPGRKFAAEDKDLQKMELYHRNRVERLEVGFKKLVSYKEMLSEARMHWDLKKAAVEAMDEEDRLRVDMDAMLQEVLSEIAFDQVSSEYEEIFARIEVDAMEMEVQKLEFSTTEIDMTVPMNVPANVTDAVLVSGSRT